MRGNWLILVKNSPPAIRNGAGQLAAPKVWDSTAGAGADIIAPFA